MFLCLFTAVLSLAVTGSRLLYHVEPLRCLDERKVTTTGYVKENPYTQDGKYYYLLHVENFVTRDGEEVNQPTDVRLVSSTSLGLELYQEVSGGIKLFAPEDHEGYSSQKYNQAKGISFYAYPLSDFGATGKVKAPDLLFWAQKGNRWVKNRIAEIYPSDIASLLQGILLGDRSGISQEIRHVFDVCGIQHLMAVSGLHITFFAQMLFWLLNLLRVRYHRRSPLCIVGVWVFAVFVGFPVSAIRAAIMCSMVFVAQAFYLENDFLNSLGIAGLGLCIFHPLCAGDIGFQFSYLSMLAIAFSVRRIEIWRMKRKGQRVTPLLQLMIISTSIVLFLLPVHALSFGSMSAVSVIANLLILFPAQLFLLTAFCSLVLAEIPFLQAGFHLSTFFTDLLADYMLWVTRGLSKLSVGKIPLSEPTMLAWIALTLLLLSGVYFFIKRRKVPVKMIVAVCVGTLSVGMLSVAILERNDTQVGIIQREDGVVVAITEKGDTSLFVFGDAVDLNEPCGEYFSRHGLYRMNTWFLSEGTKEKSVASVAKLVECYPPQAIYYEQTEYFPQEISGRVPEECLCQGTPSLQTVKFSEGTTVRKFPSEGGAWYHVTVQKAGSLLIAVGSPRATDLPEEYRRPDLLLMQELPEQREYLHAQVVLLAAGEKDCREMLPESMTLAKYLYTTADNGELTLRFRKEKFDIRRG